MSLPTLSLALSAGLLSGCVVNLTDPRTQSPAAPRAFYAGLRGKF